MPDPQQQQAPDFIPAIQAPAPPTQDLPDFIPAIPATLPQSASTPDFIPSDPTQTKSDGTGWLQQIKDGFSQIKATDVQREGRKALLYSMGPFGAIAGIAGVDPDKYVETTPDEGVSAGKGAWDTTKSVADLPLAGKFHRKGAGTIEGETEDWITGQLNPLNIGLAVASLGTSLVEAGLVKAGVPALRAAGLVKLGRIGADLGFLTKFGYDVNQYAIPQIERDWNDYNAEQNPAKKAKLLDNMERHGTDLILGSLSMGFASRGVTDAINDYRTTTPKGKAMANTEYANGIYEYQAGNQHGSAQANQKFRELMAAVPDPITREAITHNIEAGGNPNTLREWADKAPNDQKAAYEKALKLTDKEKAVRDNLRNILDGWKMGLQAKGLLPQDGGLDNYMPHRPVFEDTDPVTGEQVQKTAADGERDFLKKRQYPSHFEGEQNGISYKTKDAVKLVSDYIERASNAIARNELGESLANGNMNDAAPMAVSGGYIGHPSDIPVSPIEIQQLKASGKLDELLQKGRIYEVPGTGEMRQAAEPTPNSGVNTPNGARSTPAGAAPTPDFIPHEPAQLPAAAPTTKEMYAGDPDREALRQKVAREYLDKATPVDKPTIIVLGGGTASGKTSIADVAAQDLPNSVRIDTDEFNTKLPDYAELQKSDPQNAAMRVHDEAKMISKTVLDNAVKERKNIILDASTSGSDSAAKIQMLKNAGYNVDLRFVDVPVEEAIRRANKRALTSMNPTNKGRFLPEDLIREKHAAAAKSFENLKDMADRARLFDNSGSAPEKVYDRIGNAPETVYNGDKYERFRNKAEATGVPGTDSAGRSGVQGLVQKDVQPGSATSSPRNPQGNASGEQGLARVRGDTEASGRKVIPAEQKIYRWKFSDYRDTGLHVYRPVGGSPEPLSNSIVPHPDMNSFPGEALARQGEGIPTDPATGQPKQRVPVFAHPEVTPHLDAVMEATSPKSPLLRGLLKFSGAAKSVLLSLSPFHWNTMMSRMLEANPTPSGVASIGRNLKRSLTMPAPVDYYHLTPQQEFAINSGVTVSSTRPGHMEYTEEGTVPGHNSLATKIPLIGRFNSWIESRLFGPQGFITGLKFDLHDKLTNELQKSMPNLTREQAGRIAASQVNNKFGGLNYTIMGRSASTQNAMRAMLLAPDFLETTGRSLTDIAGKNGGTLLKSFVAFNALHYLAARAINYLVSGQYHPESGYIVVSKDGRRDYTIRTTMGDYLHFAQHPKDFMMNRVNPMLVRTPLELLGGVDAQGNKVSNTQKMWDTARQVLPIPIQALTPKQQISQPSGADDALKAVGVNSRKRFSPAETLAYQRSTEKSQGAPLEGNALEKSQTKYKLEDDLRNAVQAKDAKAVAKGKQAIIQNVRDKTITSDEANKLIQDAVKYPTRLSATVARLPLEDAFDVWNAASQQEKKALRQTMLGKVSGFEKMVTERRKTIEEFRALKPKITQFLADKP
jgi:predicted ABC-type ATPase